MQLTDIAIYPLKSGHRLCLESTHASERGLANDRQWLLVTPDGQFLTARTLPQLQLISAELLPGAIRFSYPAMGSLLVQESHFDSEQQCQVWHDQFNAWHGDAVADRWFSGIVGSPCQLLWLGSNSQRLQKHGEGQLSFADGYPYLLVNENSVRALNMELTQPVNSWHFRPNLLINGAESFAEDDWQLLRIGAVRFQVNSKCTRCVMVNVDPASGKADAGGDPLKTLGRLRQFDNGICFGINLTALDNGIIQRGDAVEVLEYNLTF